MDYRSEIEVCCWFATWYGAAGRSEVEQFVLGEMRQLADEWELEASSDLREPVIAGGGRAMM